MNPMLVQPRGAVGALPASIGPLYLLLATDVLNGCVALVTEQPATAAALAVKAAVALSLALRVAWDGPVLLAAMVTLLSAGVHVLTRGDALHSATLEANLLLLKTGGTMLLMALVAATLRELPAAAVTRYLRTVLLVIAASLALGLAGWGHDRYGDEEAFLSANGFMPAGNELNVALLALFWWLSERRQAGMAAPLDRGLSVLCLGLMLLSGSKTTIVSALLIGLWFQRRRPLRLMGVLVLALLGFQLLLATAVWDRWLFFFGVHAQEGLLSALTSGRFARADDALTSWRALPPQGTPFMAVNGYVESDPLDLLLNFGAGGAAMYASFAYVLWRAADRRWLVALLVLATSALAGHVAYSVFVAPVLACALASPRRSTWQD
jgi:hypothetical protein